MHRTLAAVCAGLAVAVPAVSGLTGCYSFNTSLPGHIETVRVPVFRNETLQAEVPEEMTAAFTDRFIRDNQLKVVQSDPDAVLEGVITGYEDRVFGFNADRQAEEYVVVVTVTLALRDRVEDNELWREEGLSGVGNYFVGSSDPQQPSTPEEARATAIEQIVTVAMSRTFEGW